ncbi:hypothetical protein F5B20DRAFT_574195 [Whalleya microplaca]|nr:hypothetical protein F5B20DRAFT_574195 [Whalleya microplaca]
MADSYRVDVESDGINNSVSLVSIPSSELMGTINRIHNSIFSYLSGYDQDTPRRPVQIEDHPAGYPRFSALIASHDSFQICRQFSNLRTRLLLLKQDRLSILEQKLMKIDREESNLLRLGSSRSDNNMERQLVLSEINDALADYGTWICDKNLARLTDDNIDQLIERNHRVHSLEPARARSISNLQNWIDGTGCIAREETAYLGHSEELISIANSDDSAMVWLETLIEDGLNRLPKQGRLGISRDPNVHILPKLVIARRARGLMTPVIVVLLLVPIIVCNCLTSLTARLGTIIIATIIFVFVLSSSTRAKAVELVMAGATYTTVLVVFITSSNSSNK